MHYKDYIHHDFYVYSPVLLTQYLGHCWHTPWTELYILRISAWLLRKPPLPCHRRGGTIWLGEGGGVGVPAHIYSQLEYSPLAFSKLCSCFGLSSCRSMAQADKEAVVEPTEMESEASATWGGWLDGDPKPLSLEVDSNHQHPPSSFVLLLFFEFWKLFNRCCPICLILSRNC